MSRANSRCRYLCWISEEAGRPRFHVRAQDEPRGETAAPTPRAAWANVRPTLLYPILPERIDKLDTVVQWLHYRFLSLLTAKIIVTIMTNVNPKIRRIKIDFCHYSVNNLDRYIVLD